MVTRVAIVGGGLGGLAAAAFLHQAGVPAVVYEQARELRQVGAGIMVAPNAARMIRRLGVLGEFRKRAVRLDTGWEFRRWQDGTVLSAQDLTSESARRYGPEQRARDEELRAADPLAASAWLYSYDPFSPD